MNKHPYHMMIYWRRLEHFNIIRKQFTTLNLWSSALTILPLSLSSLSFDLLPILSLLFLRPPPPNLSSFSSSFCYFSSFSSFSHFSSPFSFLLFTYSSSYLLVLFLLYSFLLLLLVFSLIFYKSRYIPLRAAIPQSWWDVAGSRVRDEKMVLIPPRGLPTD